MAKINSYPLPADKTPQLVGYEVRNYLTNNENMETQVFESEEGDTVVQGRITGGKWKQWVGMDKAISVKLSAKKGILTVEIGEAKWVDKGAVMAVSMFVLWPLAVTSGVGMYKQAKLPDKIFDCIRTYLNS